MKIARLYLIVLTTLGCAHLHAQDFVLYPLSIYSESGIYGIGIKDQGLMVTAQRPSTRLMEYKDQNGNNSTAIFLVPDTSSRKLQPLQAFAQNQLNESCAQYVPELDMYVITRSMESTNHNRKATALGIFFMEKKGDTYMESAFPYNDLEYKIQTGQGYYDSQTQRLYYVSNSEEGMGDTDIYCSSRTEQGWSKPTPLSSSVNSDKNEAFPSINRQGDLIFSSQRGQHGDYDLYRAKWNGQTFEPAERLDEPFNSSADDLQMLFTTSNEQGYLVSNRENGIDRVFAFYVPRPEFKDCAESLKPHFCYLFEETTIVPNDTIPMLYEWSFSDGNRYSGLKVKHCFAGLGEYNATLNVYDSTTKVLYANLSELQLSIQKSQLPFIHGNEKFAFDSLQRFEAQATEIDSFDVREIHWQFGDGHYERGDVVFHQYPDAGTYQVDLLFLGINQLGELESRCATKTVYAIGPANEQEVLASAASEEEEKASVVIGNNTFLSTSRDSVEYFVEFKQSETKMEIDDPFFANIHFEITERTSNRDSLYHYTVGAEEDFAATLPILQDLRANGYTASVIKDQEQDISKRSTVRNWWYIPDSIESALNKQMNKFNDIKFELGSFAINKQSYDELNYIVQVMQSQPKIYLEIVAHTDSIGTAENNQILSEKRANSVAEYMINQGIKRTRLVTKGLGEQQSSMRGLNPKTLADDRRVEFKIIRKS